MVRGRTLREGLFSSMPTGMALALVGMIGVAEAGGDLSALLAIASTFSCELGGSGASLLGTGVEGFLVEGFAFGKKFALVSFKHEGFVGSEGCFFAVAGPDGEDFWKKEKIDRCFAEEEAERVGLGAAPLAGVRAAPILLPVSSPAIGAENGIRTADMGWQCFRSL